MIVGAEGTSDSEMVGSMARGFTSVPDAAARPMFNSFTDKADLTAYKHELAQIDLNTKNDKNAFGLSLSNKMDFSDYDRVNDFEMNYVLWHAVMGKDAPQPPAVQQRPCSPWHSGRCRTQP